MEVIDNFLHKEIFDPMQVTMLGYAFPWFYNSDIVDENDQNELFQFVHLFFSSNKNHVDEHYNTGLYPVYDALGVKTLYRVKANLNVRTNNHHNTGFHVDIPTMKCKTAILYMNTNNGWTEFENGDRVDSVENRLVIFDSQMKHAGNTSTDQKIRVLINFNYD